MNEEYRIDYVDNPEESAWGSLDEALGVITSSRLAIMRFNACVMPFVELTRKSLPAC